MKHLRLPLQCALAAGLLAGCINIHLHFPEEPQIREAAREIVEEVTQSNADGNADDDEANGGEAGDSSEASLGNGHSALRLAGGGGGSQVAAHSAWLGVSSAKVAYAAEAEPRSLQERKIKIDVTTPAIKEIRKTLKARNKERTKLFQDGTLGEKLDGYVAERDTKELNLKEKRDLRALIAAENTDRKNLYLEIAKANELDPSRVAQIGQIFGEVWIENAKPGWWIEIKKGNWEKKKKKRSK